MKVLTKIRRWSWEFPQSLLGAILLLFYKRDILRTIEYRDQKVNICDSFPGGISLGYYVFVKYKKPSYLDPGRIERLKTSVKHESGHGVQSKYLGPLYLLTVSILSGVHCLICTIKDKYKIPYNYYAFITEKSADKLGGVKREIL